MPTQIRPHPSMQRKGEYKVPSLTEALLATDSYQERESVFFKGVRETLGRLSTPQWRSHFQECMGSTDLT